MTRDEFARRITALTGTLYRVSWGLLRREADREDAVQEAILRAWEKLPSLRREELFETWVIRILINECYAIGRRLRRQESLAEAPEPLAEPPGDPVLRDGILSLPPKYRTAVLLHYVEGYSVAEAARILGVPDGTVKTWLYRARSLLKKTLEEAQEE